MKLRNYQNRIIAEVKAHIAAGVKDILILSPTGSGKTALTANILQGAAAKGNTSWFGCHRRELIKQSVDTFLECNVPVGIIAANFPQMLDSPVQVCSIQTLQNRLPHLTKPKIMIFDEAHHCAAASWEKVFNWTVGSIHIGLTATPERPDGKGLKKYFKVMVRGPGVQELIDEKFLSDYHLYSPNPPDMSQVKIARGDYVIEQAEEVVDKPTITGDAITHYQRYASGKRALVFCVSINHSKHVVEQFVAAGIRAAHIDGETRQDERDDIIAQFMRGEIEVISNCDLFGEGFDCPGIECVIMLRPTTSLPLYLQQAGRGLRPIYAPGFDLETIEGRTAAVGAGGKTHAIILDHVGNSQRHGLPCEEREWSLEGKEGRKKKAKDDDAFRVKTCLHCFRANETWRKACKYDDCKSEFPAEERRIEHVEGELGIVDKEAAKRIAQEKRVSIENARTYTELYAHAVKYKYKDPHAWAYMKKTKRAEAADRHARESHV